MLIMWRNFQKEEFSIEKSFSPSHEGDNESKSLYVKRPEELKGKKKNNRRI